MQIRHPRHPDEPAALTPARMRARFPVTDLFGCGELGCGEVRLGRGRPDRLLLGGGWLGR